MPVVGLPPAVEAALSSLMAQNILTSWRITGGKSFAQLTLRFSMADMSSLPGEGMNNGVQYRRKPPSAIARDERRRQEWLKVADSDCHSNSMKRYDENNTQVQSESTVTHFTSGANIHVTRSGSAMGIDMDTPELPQSDLVTDVFTESENDNKSVDTASTCSKLSSHTNSTACDGNVTNSGYTCDICTEDIMDNTWFRCTRCVSDEDDVYDLCKTCVAMHSYHDSFIQKYDLPSDPDQYSCYSCGKIFMDNRSKVLKCTVCKFFIMCKRCEKEGKHGHHKNKLQSFTRGRLKTVTSNE